MFKVIIISALVVSTRGDCSSEDYFLRGPMLVLATSQLGRRFYHQSIQFLAINTCLWFNTTIAFGKRSKCDGNVHKIIRFTGDDQFDNPSKILYFNDASGAFITVSKKEWLYEVVHHKCSEKNHSENDIFKIVVTPIDEHVCFVTAKKHSTYYYSLVGRRIHTCARVRSLISEVATQNFDLGSKKLVPTCCYKRHKR